MRAVRVQAWNVEPSVVDVDTPAREHAHTLIEVHAATVGHVDRTIWSGAFLRHPPLPYTPGVEGSGVVLESDTFEVGERVWIRGGGLGTARDGTWAEIISAPDEAIGSLPQAVPFDVGSAFFSPCTSAWIAVHSIGDLRPGQRIIVTGATGAVGSIATQLALEAGAEVIGTVSRPERLASVAPGARGIVVSRGSDDTAAPDATLDADLLIDTVGGGVLANLLPSVSPGGAAVLVGYLAGATLELDLPSFMQRDVTLHPLNMIRREPEGRAIAPDLLARLGDGRITLDVTTFPLDAASEAMNWLDAPGHVGRAVLAPNRDRITS